MPLAAADISTNRSRPMLGFALAAGLVALVAGGKAILFDTLDPDCFWHLRIAEQLRMDGIGMLIDRLSFASDTSPWTPYSWLAELAMKGIWDSVGWRGAVAVQALLQTAFALLLAVGCFIRLSYVPREMIWTNSRAEAAAERGVALRAVVAGGFATFLALPYLSFRPVTLALVILALCAGLLIRDRCRGERSRSVWLLVPLTALLVNIHLYAVIVPLWLGTLLVGAAWELRLTNCPGDRPQAGRRVDRYALLLVACLVGCLLTPMLPGVIATALHYQYDDPMVAGPFIEEMQPFYHGMMGKAAAGIVILMLVCAIRNRSRLRMGERLWLLLSVVLLLRLGRFAPVFAIAAAPIFAVTLPNLSDRLLTQKPVCALMMAVLIAGGVRLISAFPHRGQSMATWLNRHGSDAPGYPCAAADFVAAHVRPTTGRLINEFSWGGYLEWHLGDQYQTLLDGRTQVFTPEFWRATYLAEPHERTHFLAGMHADAAIVPVRNSTFRTSLVQLGWRSAFHDDRAEVLLPPPNAEPEIQWPTAAAFFGD